MGMLKEELGKNQLSHKMRKTLLLMSFTCASFGTAQSMELLAAEELNEQSSKLSCSSSPKTREQFHGKAKAHPSGHGEKECRNKGYEFLEDLTTTLQGINDLERLVASFIPQHPLNPIHVSKYPAKSTDWRLQLPSLGSDKSSEDTLALQERLDKIPPEKQKGLLDQKRQKDKERREKFKKEVVDPINKRHEVEEANQKYKTAAGNLTENFSCESLQEPQPASEEDKKRVSEMLGEWFLSLSEPALYESKIARKRIHILSQWLTALPPQVMDAMIVKHLLVLLEKDRKSPEILKTLNGFIVDYIHLKTQPLYEQLWPFYLESRISSDALRNAKLEVEREENALNTTINNWVHFGNLQATMVDAVNGAVAPWLVTYLKKVSDEHNDLKTKVTDSLRQAMDEVKGLEINPFGKLDTSWVEVFRNIIGDVLLDAQQMALQQAAGQQSSKLMFNPTTNVWSVKVGEDTAVYSAPYYELEANNIFINVSPILDKLYQFIKRHLGYWDKKAPPPVYLARVPIAEGDKRLWKVPEFRTILPSDTIKTFRGKVLQIIPPIKYVPKVGPQPDPQSEEWDIQKKMERQELLAQIKQLRSPGGADNKGKKRPSHLEAFFASRDRVFFMHALPGVLTHHVERVGPLFKEMRTFFQKYMTEISTIQKDLETGTERKFYLNTKRTDLDLLNHPEKKYQRIQPLFRQGVRAKDWEQISAFMTNPPKFTKKDSENDERFILRKFEFAKGVKELVMISLILDNLYEQAMSKELNYDLLTVEMIRDYGEKLRKFMSKHAFLEVFHEGRSRRVCDFEVLLKQQRDVEQLLVILQAGRSEYDFRKSYENNWNAVIGSFACLFQAQLGTLLQIFNENMFIILKKMYLPTLHEFEKTKDFKIVERSASHSTEPNVPSTLGPLPEEFGKRSINDVNSTTPTGDLTSSEKDPSEGIGGPVTMISRDILPPRKAKPRSTPVDSSKGLSTLKQDLTTSVGEKEIPVIAEGITSNLQSAQGFDPLLTRPDSQTTTAHPMSTEETFEETLTPYLNEQDFGSPKEAPRTPVTTEGTTHSPTTSIESHTPLHQSAEVKIDNMEFVMTEDTDNPTMPAQGLTAPVVAQEQPVTNEELNDTSPSTDSHTPLHQSAEIGAHVEHSASLQIAEGPNTPKEGLSSSEGYREKGAAEKASRFSPSSASKTPVKKEKGKRERAQSS